MNQPFISGVTDQDQNIWCGVSRCWMLSALVGQVAVADGLELLQLVLEHHALLHRVVHLLVIIRVYSLWMERWNNVV